MRSASYRTPISPSSTTSSGGFSLTTFLSALEKSELADIQAEPVITTLDNRQADILVVPDIEAGNMLAKQLEHLAEATSAGIVLGARVPIVLTSRSDSAETRAASTAVAAVMACHRTVKAQ